MKYLILIVILIVELLACRCPIPASKDAFCRADWVSHVKVLGKQTISNGDPLNNVRYRLKHLEVFRAPNGTKYLPAIVSTSSESSACGISLEKGKQYLLSGSSYEGKYHTSTCVQVVTDDPNDKFDGSLMEWKDVSAAFEKRLRSFTC